MGKTTPLLQQAEHRPFPLPHGKWCYYQEWNKVLFLHWEMPLNPLKKQIPSSLEIDTFKGKAYVSLVAFTMQKIHPRYLPAVKSISDFDEINIRTYVIRDGKPGVYFLNIEAGKTLSAKVAKTLSGLPYEKAEMFRKKRMYLSANKAHNNVFEAHYKTKELKQPKTDLDRWLTERYYLYLAKNDFCYRYDIHHLEWEIQTLNFDSLVINYAVEDYELTTPPDLCHYSKGVQVLAWKRKKCVNNERP